MKIRDFVDVVPQPTVVRLDQLNEAQSGWISERYYITSELERHVGTLRHLLDRQGGSGIFLIGHFGSGKSHFLAYITQQIRAGKLSARPPEVFPISLLNFPASESLESIVTQEVGLQPQAPDRRMVWSKAAELHSKGIFLAVDELSEFLCSKPNRQSFNEDIRFLQFL